MNNGKRIIRVRTDNDGTTDDHVAHSMGVPNENGVLYIFDKNGHLIMMYAPGMWVTAAVIDHD